MNIRISYFDLAALVTFYLLFANVGVCADNPTIANRIEAAQSKGSLSNLVSLQAEIEKLWPVDPPDYFENCDLLGKALELSSLTNTSARDEVEKSSELALGKPCPKDALLVQRCFYAKGAIVARLARVGEAKPSLHTAELIARSMGEARSAIITNYKPVYVTANVAPPLMPRFSNRGSIIMMEAGMDPKEIDDPVARDAYEKAIAKNTLGMAQNTFQQELPGIIIGTKFWFYGYCHKLFLNDAVAKQQKDELARAAHLTPEESQRLGIDW